MSEPCTWVENLDDGNGVFETTCGETFYSIDGNPLIDWVKFCCYCGRKTMFSVREEKDD